MDVIYLKSTQLKECTHMLAVKSEKLVLLRWRKTGPSCPRGGGGRRGRTTPVSQRASWRNGTWTNYWSEPGKRHHRRPAVPGKTDKTAERPTTLPGPGDTEHSWQHKVGYRAVNKQHVGLNISTMTDLGLASLHRAAVNSWWCVMASDARRSPQTKNGL